eukprot:2811666-Prymnesium_polylepis.1
MYSSCGGACAPADLYSCGCAVRHCVSLSSLGERGLRLRVRGRAAGHRHRERPLGAALARPAPSAHAGGSARERRTFITITSHGRCSERLPRQTADSTTPHAIAYAGDHGPRPVSCCPATTESAHPSRSAAPRIPVVAQTAPRQHRPGSTSPHPRCAPPSARRARAPLRPSANRDRGLGLQIKRELADGLVPIEFGARDGQPASQALYHLLAERLVDVLELDDKLRLESRHLALEGRANVA